MSFCMILFLFLFFTWELKVRCLKHKWVLVCVIMWSNVSEKRKKKNVLQHLCDFPLSDGVIDFYITTQALLISHCIS